jgi:hypothetical protein
MTPFPLDTAVALDGSGVLGTDNVRVPIKKNPDKAFEVSPIRPSPERKYAYVYETPESKSHNSFDEYPDSACPGAGSSNCTGVVHRIGGWEARKIPGEQDRQPVPIRALVDVLSSQIIHTKQRNQYSSKQKDFQKKTQK